MHEIKNLNVIGLSKKNLIKRLNSYFFIIISHILN